MFAKKKIKIPINFALIQMDKYTTYNDRDSYVLKSMMRIIPCSAVTWLFGVSHAEALRHSIEA